MSFSKRDLDSYERNDLFSEKRSLSDAELVILAQAGDKIAFDFICERYYNQIYRFQTRMVGDSWTGEDLAQETFLKAWKALTALRDPPKFLSWLYRIAANEVFSYRRRPDVLTRGSYNQKLECLQVSIPGPEKQVEAQERLEQILALISPEKCRACFILYHIEGYSILQIAEFLGIKQSSVRQYISSGLSQLRRLWEEDDTSKEKR